MKNQILDLPGEVWIPIKGFESLYKISNLGRVKGTRKTYERLVCPVLTYNGYNRVSLSKDNIRRGHRIGRLVGEHFKTKDHLQGKSKFPLQVNHINGIKTDDRADNIEWVTPSQNILHAYNEGLIDRSTRAKRWKRYNYDPFTKQLQMFGSFNFTKKLAG